MRGYPLTEKKAVPLNSVAGKANIKSLLWAVGIGAIAGFIASNLRLNLGLPGHKALFWMIPVVVTRIVGRCPVGCSSGGLAAGCSTIICGGNIAGGLYALPLIAVGGIVIDIVTRILEKRNVHPVFYICFIGLAAMAANLICLLKRLLMPAGFGIHLFSTRLISYAFFGLMAGVAGGLIGLMINRSRARKRAN